MKMKFISKSLFAVLFLFSVFLNISETVTNAQKRLPINEPVGKQSVKNILSKIIRAKHQQQPFVLITPEDLAGISKNDLNIIDSFGDPCQTAQQIEFGQSITGSLANTDCRLNDGSYADFYFFNGTQGQQLRIDLTSTVFDTYLGLANESGTWVIENDNGPDGTNSRIFAQLPATGLYIILANSFLPNILGPYSVSLTELIPCTYSLNPASANVPGNAGNYSFVLTTQAQCPWSVVTTASSWISLTGATGFGSVTINYSVAPNGTGSSREGGILIAGQVFRVTQAAIACAYSINPTSVDVPINGGTFEFIVNTQAGCGYTVYYNNNWLWASGEPRYGTRNIIYTVQPNNGSNRVGTLTVQGQTFTVRQPGRNCTYDVSPTSIRVNPAGQTSTISIDTQPGCTWTFSSGSSWIGLPFGSTGTGPGLATYRADANNESYGRAGAILFTGASSFYVTFTQFGIQFRTKLDFDGDGKTDLSIFRPAPGEWWWNKSSNGGNGAVQFGAGSDKIAAADYTGDGKTDVAFWRPSNGFWYVLRSEDFSFYAFPYGANGDVPVPGDYDADGKADAAVFRPSTNTWYISKSSGGTTIMGFGIAGDLPVNADYDGDGKADVAIFRPNGTNGAEWWIQRSSNATVFALQFGTSTDRAVPGDYTGDGKADIAVWRPSTGVWSILRSEDFSYFAFPFGTTGDLPSPGDYDGDGKFDACVFRPSNSTWYANRSTAGVLIQQFAITGDLPLPNAFVR